MDKHCFNYLSFFISSNLWTVGNPVISVTNFSFQPSHLSIDFKTFALYAPVPHPLNLSYSMPHFPLLTLKGSCSFLNPLGHFPSPYLKQASKPHTLIRSVPISLFTCFSSIVYPLIFFYDYDTVTLGSLLKMVLSSTSTILVYCL